MTTNKKQHFYHKQIRNAVYKTFNTIFNNIIIKVRILKNFADSRALSYAPKENLTI